MKSPAIKPVTAWSFSRYNSYKQCPLRFKLETIDKVPVAKSPAMERGTNIHKFAEDFLTGAAPKLAPELKAFAPEFKRLKAKKKKDMSSVLVEESWTFRKDWGATTWHDWSGAHLRTKIDAVERDGDLITVTDWKTGQYRESDNSSYLEQLDLYRTAALTVFAHVPNIRVQARLVYLDASKVYPAPGSEIVSFAADREPMQKAWEKRVAPLFADRKFAPLPNKWCGWCPHRKAAGGPCKF
jgi:RecB family exonuclease